MKRLLLAQGIYYLVTGVWPLLDLVTFQRVTGPKTDLWLVHMVGVLVTVLGAAFLAASRRKEPAPEMLGLAVAAAAGFIVVEVLYAGLLRIISPVYLADAALHALLLAAYAAGRCIPTLRHFLGS